jgi:hypothetical protein
VLAAFQASKYVDFTVLRGFHEHVERAAKDTQDVQRYIGDIFRNQALVSRLKEAEGERSQEVRESTYHEVIEESVQIQKSEVNKLQEELKAALLKYEEEKTKEKVVEVPVEISVRDTISEQRLIGRYRTKIFHIIFAIILAVTAAPMLLFLYQCLRYLFDSTYKIPISPFYHFTVLGVLLLIISVHILVRKGTVACIVDWTTSGSFPWPAYRKSLWHALLKAALWIVLAILLPLAVHRFNSRIDNNESSKNPNSTKINGNIVR